MSPLISTLYISFKRIATNSEYWAALAVMRRWRVGLDASHANVAVARLDQLHVPMPCAWCGQEEYAGDGDATLHQCVHCLQCLHIGCSTVALNTLVTTCYSRVCGPPATFPDTFKPALCKLCRWQWTL